MTSEYIPRSAIFGNPDMGSLALSPDGKYLAYLATHQGVLNIWVQEFGKPATATPVTHDTRRGIFSFSWTHSSGVLLFSQDQAGDENFGLYTVNVASKETTEIMPPGKTVTSISAVSHLRPEEVILAVNDRDARYFDYKILNLASKTLTELFTNTEGFGSVLFDYNYRPVLADKSNPDASISIFLWQAENKKFVQKSVISFEDSFSSRAVSVSLDGKKVFLLDSRGRDKAALKELDLLTGQEVTLAESQNSDVEDIFQHPKTRKILWASANYLKNETYFLDSEVQKHFEGIQKELAVDTNLKITSMSLEGDHWVLLNHEPNQPAAYHFYEVKTGALSEPLFARKALVPYAEKLHPQLALEIPSRDGYQLVSYLTQTRQQKTKSLILLVHGGPWARDSYNFSQDHQWLADRGYNVLSVNFRGSTGFGKKFLNAGNYEWGRKMHEDLIDAVQWAIQQGYAHKDRVAIMGGSYGGYAALAGLTFTPETFAAAVDIVGPSNLETLLESTPPYWESIRTNLYRRMGDPSTAEGRALLKERSPLNHADKIKRPLLILQGANDPRVKKAEADQIYNALVAKNIPVEYVLFPDEGHGFRKSQNDMAAMAIAEEFLHKHLGGVLEPIAADVKNSSAQFITTPQ